MQVCEVTRHCLHLFTTGDCRLERRSSKMIPCHPFVLQLYIDSIVGFCTTRNTDEVVNISSNVRPLIGIGSSIVACSFAIQDPVTVLGSYCGKKLFF